jgi:hypothetical protein
MIQNREGAEAPGWESMMAERTYLLAIDASCGFEDIEKIRQYVTTSSDFSSWWNHLPMLFMLDSQMESEAIAEKLHALSPGARFLLTEVNLGAAQGWLPEVSWKWIEKRALSTTAQHGMRV